MMFELPDNLPPVLTREQVLFSWALGETYSPRWRDTLLENAKGTLKEKLLRSETRDFTPEERRDLIALFTVFRENFILEYIDKAKTFRITRLPSGHLGQLVVLPSFAWEKRPVTLATFLTWESKEEWEQDPRQAARKLFASPPAPPYRGLPIVAYNDKLRCDVLIDGYCRCITALWQAKEGKKPPATIPIIYCERRPA